MPPCDRDSRRVVDTRAQAACSSFALVLLLLMSVGSPAIAGRNFNGAMLLHVDNSVTYSQGQSYCASDPLPATCDDLVTDVTRDPSVDAVIWMVGAFAVGSDPGVTAFQVGLSGDVTNVNVDGFGVCDPSALEIPDPGWPGAGTGDAVAYLGTVSSILFKMYWFAVKAPGAGSSLSTTNYPHGDMQAEWVDDSTPPQVDYCEFFGTVRWGGAGSKNCPSSQPGACCFHDGHCADLSPIDCDSQGGFFEGGGTSCAAFQCPQPTGACCFRDGHCTILTQAQCAAQGATWRGMDTTCSPNPCPPPIGACCFHNGSCTALTQAQCAGQGGAWQGMDTVCDPNSCPPPIGACCFHDGHCTVLTQAQCLTQGGAWSGMDTACNPNHCPPPTGACCFHNGNCTALTQAQCAGQGGVWHGMDTVCDPNPCPQPTGACCFSGAACQVMTQAACATHGGTWQGMDTACAPNPCPQTAGACCFPNGYCAIYNPTECQALCGTYQGDNTSCTPNPCPPRGRALAHKATATLSSNPLSRKNGTAEVRGGRNAGGAMVLHVDNSICYSTNVDYCSIDPLPSTCEDLVTNVARDPNVETMIWMVAAFPSNSTPGVVAFQVGVTGDIPESDFSAFGPCGPGVLELPDGTWPEPGTGTACAFSSAVNDRLFKIYWFAALAPGAGSSLGTTNYPHGDMQAEWVDDSAPPRIDVCAYFGTVVWGRAGQNQCPVALANGACCFQNGSCQLLLNADCVSEGGTWQGEGTVCDPSPCVIPIGACCFADGGCTVVTREQCVAEGGSYQADGIACNPNPCPVPSGACCLADAQCTILTRVECQQEGGSFRGDGTTCTPNPCTQTGACCAGSSCTILTQYQCAQQGGIYVGDNTSCIPSPCCSSGNRAENPPRIAPPKNSKTTERNWHWKVNGRAIVPETEPNCSCPGQAINCGDTVDPACLCTNGDYDWYYFSANAGDAITVATFDAADCTYGVGVSDTYIYLYANDCTTVLAQDDDSGPGFYSLINAFTAPYTGTYEVAVRAYSSSELGCYSLTFSCGTLGTGACCLSGGVCQTLNQIDCGNSGGTYQGNNVPCAPNPCPQPPANDVCSGAIVMDRCTAGSLSGDTTPYTNNYDPGSGGCSSGYAEIGKDAVYVVDLNATDIIEMTYTQLNLDGAFYIVTDCSNIAGSCVAGADATVTGQPETIHYVAGSTGTYYIILDSYTTGGGPWTLDYFFACAPPPVAQACCFQDGHCEMQLPADCRAMGGTPQGDGTNCETTPCAPPPIAQACCFPDGHCEMQLPADCRQMGGTPQGEGTICENTTCLANPTKSTTWGRIKAGYR